MCLEILGHGKNIKASKDMCFNHEGQCCQLISSCCQQLSSTKLIQIPPQINRFIIQSEYMSCQAHTHLLSHCFVQVSVFVFRLMMPLTSLSGLSCSSVVLLWWGLRCEEEGDLWQGGDLLFFTCPHSRIYSETQVQSLCGNSFHQLSMVTYVKHILS